MANELHKPLRKRFARRRVVSNGIDDIWSADLIEMQEFAKSNKGIRYLLNVIDVFSKYVWSIPLKDKTGNSTVEAFNKLIKIRKPNKLWVDKGKEFYNKSMDKWLEDNYIHRYSTFNEGKAVVIERFNRTLKEIMWKYFTTNNTNKYIDSLDDMVSTYNNTLHRSIKMTPSEASQIENEDIVRSNLYGGIKERTKKTKFKVGDHVRIPRYKRLFEKGYTPNWTKEIFQIDKIQNTNPVTYLIKDLNNEEILGSFYEPELQKTNM